MDSICGSAVAPETRLGAGQPTEFHPFPRK